MKLLFVTGGSLRCKMIMLICFVYKHNNFTELKVEQLYLCKVKKELYLK